MSSLAEIKQQLMEQNKEQERTSVAIEDVRKALIAQMKEERRGRLDEKEDRQEAKKVAQKPQGFMAGLAEGTGAAGLGRFAQSLLGALFGGLSGGAIAGLAGTVAGKLLKGTVLAGLISTFGEDAIKSLFDKLKEKGIDFGFSKEQEDEIASRATDGLFAYVISGIIFRNPLVRIAAAIGTAYRDKIFDVIEYVLGIKITDLGGKNGFVVSMPNFFGGNDFKLDETWINGLTTAVTAFTAWLGLKLLKMGKNLIFKGQDKIGKAVDKAMKAERARLDNFEKQLAAERAARIDAERRFNDSMQAKQAAMSQRIAAERAARIDAESRLIDAERRLDKQSGSRTAAGQNLADELARLEAQQRLIAQSGSRTVAGQNLADDLARLEAEQRLIAQSGSRTIAGQNLADELARRATPKVFTSVPVQPSSPAVKATSELSKLSDLMIEEAGFSRKLSSDGRILFFDNRGKFASPNLVLDETQRIQAANAAKKAKRTGVTKTVVKSLIGADLAISGLSGAAEAVEAGDTTRGDITAGVTAGIATAGLDLFALGTNLIADASEGYLKALQQYFGTYDPEKFEEGERLNFSLLREDIRKDVGGQLNKVGALGEEASEETKLAIIESNDAVTNFFTKIGENIKGVFSGEEPPDPYATMTQADYVKLASEGFSGSTASGYSMPAPVIIQDQSVRQGGNQTNVTNQIDTPIQSFDASWYQRRAAMGLGL